GPGHHLRLRGRPPQAPVRVRQDAMAERRHLHRRAGREGSARRSQRRIRSVHHPAAPDPPSPAEPAAVRDHPGRRVLLRPGAAGPALARRAGHLNSMEENVATSPTRTDRWKALDFGPPPSGMEEPESPVLVEYARDERVAIITLNRPHADNAITTAM